MIFTHDTEVALQVCVALVNDEPHRRGPLASPDALLTFLLDAEDTGVKEATTADLEALAARLPRLRRLLLADRDEAAQLVNEILADAQALPQLRRHGSWDWHLHAIGETQPLADRIAVETAMAMVDLIRSAETQRIATCAATDCDDLLVDLSRNRSRRFCSTACGNREAVAAYRARQRS